MITLCNHNLGTCQVFLHGYGTHCFDFRYVTEVVTRQAIAAMAGIRPLNRWPIVWPHEEAV